MTQQSEFEETRARLFEDLIQAVLAHMAAQQAFREHAARTAPDGEIFNALSDRGYLRGRRMPDEWSQEYSIGEVIPDPHARPEQLARRAQR